MADWIASWLESRRKCQSCAVYESQLRESRLREQRMARQLEEKDRQIAMVLEAKFDRPHIVQEPTADPVNPFPLEALSDVNEVSDDRFLEEIEARTH